ncbi:MAG: MerR family transcriptional regulator [Acidimicrobiales bacterium]
MSAHPEDPSAKQASKSIRDVLALLSEEFPDVTVSKIRFLESRGLIHPERSASGYRKFTEEDIERLRWILLQQREHFLPLKVIKGRLEQAGATMFAPSLFESADEGVATTASANVATGSFDDDDDFNQDPDDPPPQREVDELEIESEEQASERSDLESDAQPSAEDAGPRTPTGGGPKEPRRPAHRASRSQKTPIADRRPAEALAKLARVDVAFLEELEAFALIENVGTDASANYGEDTVRIVELAARLRGYGIEPRHLRTFKHAAERESGVLEQVIMPMLQRRNPEAQKRARAVLSELVEVAAQLHDAFMRASLREIDTR